MLIKIEIVELECHDVICCCDFSPDGKKLAYSSKDGTITMWDIENNDIIKKMIHFDHNSFYDKDDQSHVTLCKFMPDGKHLISTGIYYVKMWCADTGSFIKNISTLRTYNTKSLDISSDGQTMCVIQRINMLQ